MRNWSLKRKLIIFILSAVYLPLITLTLFTQTFGHKQRTFLVKAMAEKDNASEIIITQSLLDYLFKSMSQIHRNEDVLRLQRFLTKTKNINKLKDDLHFNQLLDQLEKNTKKTFPTEGPNYYSLEVYLPNGISIFKIERAPLEGGRLSEEVISKKFPLPSIPKKEIKTLFNELIPKTVLNGIFSLNPQGKYITLQGVKTIMKYKNSKLLLVANYMLTSPLTKYDVLFEKKESNIDGTFFFDQSGSLLFPPEGAPIKENAMRELLPNAPESFFSNRTSIYKDEDGNLYYKGETESKLEGLEKVIIINYFPKEMIMGPFNFFLNILLGIILLFGLISIPTIYYFIKKYISPLEKILGNLKQSSKATKDSSLELESTATDLAESSLETSSGMENILESMEKINSTQISIKSEVELADSLSAENAKVAKISELGNKKLITSIEEMSKSSKNIGSITDIIEDISFQTNLLSLNASVEAARAGEQGRGFGVVAGSIRELSGKTSESAKNISELIAEGIKKSKQGSILAEENSKILTKVVKNILDVNINVDKIANSLKVQSDSVKPLNLGLQQVDQMFKVTSKKAIECNNISNELANQTKNLEKIINNLSKILEGKS